MKEHVADCKLAQTPKNGTRESETDDRPQIEANSQQDFDADTIQSVVESLTVIVLVCPLFIFYLKCLACVPSDQSCALKVQVFTFVCQL